jgi:hypothetical protein
VVADPLITEVVGVGGEDIKADFAPVGNSLGEFESFAAGVVGGEGTVGRVGRAGDGFYSVDGIVGVKLGHESLGSDSVGSVNLDLVVILRAKGGGRDESKEEREDHEASYVHLFSILF